MRKMTIYLTGQQSCDLAHVSRAEGRSKADLIREGIDIVIARHRVAEPILPLFDSGIPDLAARADDYLDGFGES